MYDMHSFVAWSVKRSFCTLIWVICCNYCLWFGALKACWSCWWCRWQLRERGITHFQAQYCASYCDTCRLIACCQHRIIISPPNVQKWLFIGCYTKMAVWVFSDFRLKMDTQWKYEYKYKCKSSKVVSFKYKNVLPYHFWINKIQSSNMSNVFMPLKRTRLLVCF